MDKRTQQLTAALILFAIAVVLSYYSVEEKEVIIKSEASEADVILVLDVSGSMASPMDPMKGTTKIESAKDAAIEFLNTLNTTHRVGLIAFSDSPQLLSSITSNRSNLQQKIRGLHPGGGTAMRDAVKSGINTISAGSGTNRRLCMVLMTDGLPNPGQDPASEIPSLVSKNITTYTVGFGSPGDIDENLLRNIAMKTNGNYSYANSRVDLINAFVKVSDSVNTVTEMKGVFYYGSRGLIIIALILIIFLPEFVGTGKKVVAKIKGE